MSELPGEPVDHMNALLRLLLPFARSSIVTHGTLEPLGACMATDGELETAQADGNPSEAVDEIRGGFRGRADRGELVAAGICTAVALDEEGWPGGVSIQLEHRDSEPFTLVHPYRRTDDGTTTWGEAFRIPGHRSIWGAAG